MAKAKTITGLNCNADASEMAARVLRVRFDEVISFHAAAMRPRSVNGVHDMRVASRRLRSALRDFSPVFKKQRLEEFKNDLKFLADTLGTVRDQDVAIASLKKLREKTENKAIRSEIHHLIAERRPFRKRSHDELKSILSPQFISGLQQRFSAAVDDGAAPNKSAPFTFRETGRDLILASLNDLLDRGTRIYEPFNSKALHKLRLAAKHLRYAIELFAQCWDGSLDEYAKEMAGLQSHLGEVHDADAWIEFLGRDIEHNTGRKHHRQTAAWLISEFTRRRTKEYRAALKLWNEWETADLAERLRSAILRP